MAQARVEPLRVGVPFPYSMHLLLFAYWMGEARRDFEIVTMPPPLMAQAVAAGSSYAVSGGKRLRGFLVLEGARMLGLPDHRALSAAAAVEALHAYSLVHDDLPSMDDDDLRRGLPTVHVKWDEATAVLAGDALQTLAFELLTDPALGTGDTRIAGDSSRQAIRRRGAGLMSLLSGTRGLETSDCFSYGLLIANRLTLSAPHDLRPTVAGGASPSIGGSLSRSRPCRPVRSRLPS